MKNSTALTTILALGLAIGSVQAEKIVAGPKGGRLLENEPPRAEFFIEKDHTVTITFYDKDLKPVAVSAQTVTAIAEAKSGKTKLEFEKKGDALGSKSPLPAGDGYIVVVQVRATPDAKPQNFRIALNMSQCGGCKLAEYACTCGH